MFRETKCMSKQVSIYRHNNAQSAEYPEGISPGKINKVLIVEDDEETRNTITILLENEQYEVIQAINDEEGIKYYRQYNPDLVLWNIKLLFENEDEIQNKIRYIEQENHKPFIVLADMPSYKEYRKVMALGADDYICKPYDASLITKTINGLVKRYENLRNRIEDPDSTITRSEINENIVIRYHGKIIPISIKKIFYISVERQYSKIFVESNKSYIIKKSLSKWEQILPQNDFIRIHRSTLVNISKIKEAKRVNNNLCNVYLSDSDIVLNMTRNYYKNLNQYALRK